MKRIAAIVALGLAVNGWGGISGGAAFLKIDPSVKGEALGGWNPAASHGAGALGVNPANAMVGEGYEFMSGFASLIGNSAYGTLGVAAKRSENFTVGAEVTFLQSANLQGRDANGNITTNFNARSLAGGLTASWGTESFRVGGTAKAVQEQIGQLKSNTVPAGDVGVGFKTGTIEWGAAALNLGSGIKFQGEKEGLPTIYSLGSAIPLGGGLTGLAGVEHLANEGQTYGSLGLEYQLRPISVRLGYRNGGLSNLAAKSQQGSAQTLEGLTGGIGVNFKNFRVDYAVSQTAVEYGMSQRAAITFKWGGESEEAQPKARPVARRTRTQSPMRTTAPKGAKSDAGVTTGSRRAYDPQPIEKRGSKKRWVD